MDIKQKNLRVYELPPCDEDEDESFKMKDKLMKASECGLWVTFLFFTFYSRAGSVKLACLIDVGVLFGRILLPTYFVLLFVSCCF